MAQVSWLGLRVRSHFMRFYIHQMNFHNDFVIWVLVLSALSVFCSLSG